MLNKFQDWLFVHFDRENTIQTYYYQMKKFFEAHSEFNQDTVFEYIKFLRQNQRSLESINQFIKAGKQYAKFQKITIEFPKHKTEEAKIPPYISEDTFLDIIEKIPIVTNYYLKWQSILSLGFYCALRRQEITNLLRKDFDLEKCLVKIYNTKTKYAKIVPFPKSVGILISNYFSTEQEKTNAFNTTKQGINYICNQVKQYFGLEKFYPHLLRHSCIRYLFDKGVPLNKIQVITGHKRLATLEIYARCRNEELNDLYTKQIKTEIDKRKKRRK
ncbi:MAG: site-specific integrase [Candidatus Thorarchaeota archaeon]|jgi:integrase